MDKKLLERINNLEGDISLYNKFQPYIDKMTLGDFTLSASSIKAFAQSPLHFLKYKVDEFVTTPSMEAGKLLHMLILEPHKFLNHYMIKTKAEGFEGNAWNKKENKEKAEMLQAEADATGKTLIDLSVLEDALDLKDAILTNSYAGELIKGCNNYERKFKMKWKGFNWTGIIDGVANNYIIDLKKVPDAEPRKVRWEIRNRRFNWQGLLYMRAMKMFNDYSFYYNICYDGNGNVTVVRQDWFSLSMAEAQIIETLKKLEDCIIGENWLYSYEFNTEMGYYTSSELESIY